MRNNRIAFIACLCLLTALCISAIDVCCFNKEFYASEYEKLNTAESIGISDEDLEKATDVLLDYLKGEREDLFIQAVVKGETREVFNEREKTHMVDVKALYQNVMFVRNIAYGAAAVLFFLVFFKKKQRSLFSSYKKAMILFIAIFALIGICCLIDFDAFWTTFHHIFFAGNDLWLLDPKTDILIMMVPGDFFFALCISIILCIFLSFILLYIVFYFLDRKVFKNVEYRPL